MFLVFLGAELLLRLFPLPVKSQDADVWPWIVMDPVLGWKNMPDFDRNPAFRINSHGFRGPEIPPVKTDGVRRIVCLGDSGTFGIWGDGTADEPRIQPHGYPHYLARIARSHRDDAVEVINAGVIGYSSSHGLRQLVTQLLPLDPDIVTVRFAFNDSVLSRQPARRVHEPSNPLVRRSLYALHGFETVRLFLETYAMIPFFHPAPSSVPWTPLDGYKENLRRFAEIAREEDLRLLFIDYPLRPMEWGEQPNYARHYRMGRRLPSMADLYAVHAEYEAALRLVADEERVPVLTTRATLTRLDDPGFGDLDLAHPNRTGARKLAVLIWKRILDLGWINGR